LAALTSRPDPVEAFGGANGLAAAVALEVYGHEAESGVLDRPDHVGAKSRVDQAIDLSRPKLDAGDLAVVPDPKDAKSKGTKGRLRPTDRSEAVDRNLRANRYTRSEAWARWLLIHMQPKGISQCPDIVFANIRIEQWREDPQLSSGLHPRSIVPQIIDDRTVGNRIDSTLACRPPEHFEQL
jgi:hypothetical protein